MLLQDNKVLSYFYGSNIGDLVFLLMISLMVFCMFLLFIKRGESLIYFSWSLMLLCVTIISNNMYPLGTVEGYFTSEVYMVDGRPYDKEDLQILLKATEELRTHSQSLANKSEKYNLDLQEASDLAELLLINNIMDKKQK